MSEEPRPARRGYCQHCACKIGRLRYWWSRTCSSCLWRISRGGYPRQPGSPCA